MSFIFAVPMSNKILFCFFSAHFMKIGRQHHSTLRRQLRRKKQQKHGLLECNIEADAGQPSICTNLSSWQFYAADSFHIRSQRQAVSTAAPLSVTHLRRFSFFASDTLFLLQTVPDDSQHKLSQVPSPAGTTQSRNTDNIFLHAVRSTLKNTQNQLP